MARDIENGIAQIEDLSLPKRAEKRRPIYLGEQVTCYLRFGKNEIEVDIVDLSLRGLAIVETREKIDFPYAKGQKLSLEFERGSKSYFSLEGEISNIGQVRYQGKTLRRIGLNFYIEQAQNREDFVAKLGENILACKSTIRPQACCFDPFFFQELWFFQIEGFTPRGIELLVSARLKSLLPLQPFELDVYVPGRGRFMVPVVNSRLLGRCSQNRYRLFVHYLEAPKAFLEAVSEHLVMFGEGATPALLRQDGFLVGDLSRSLSLTYARPSSDILKKEGLVDSVLGFPSEPGAKELHLDRYARCVRASLGPHLVALFALVFVEGERERSLLERSGYQLADHVVQGRHIELGDFYISQNAVLVDFLLPMLKNVVRIAVQSRSKYLLVECESQLRPILQKMGFQDHNATKKSKGKEPSPRRYLMELTITKALVNKDKFLPPHVWKVVYHELYEFLRKRARRPQTKK